MLSIDENILHSSVIAMIITHPHPTKIKDMLTIKRVMG